MALHRTGGFTLVEVAASVAILGGVIVALLAARGRSVEAHAAALRAMTASRLCASQAALLRAGLVSEGRGGFPQSPGYSWAIRRQPLTDDMPAGLRAYEVTVSPPAATETGVSVRVWMFVPSDVEEKRP